MRSKIIADGVVGYEFWNGNEWEMCPLGDFKPVGVKPAPVATAGAGETRYGPLGNLEVFDGLIWRDTTMPLGHALSGTPLTLLPALGYGLGFTITSSSGSGVTLTTTPFPTNTAEPEPTTPSEPYYKFSEEDFS